MQEEYKIGTGEDQKSSSYIQDEELLKQIKSEKEVSSIYMDKKRQKWNNQMHLMNNTNLNPGKIGDETMYSTFNTVQSYLDEDELMVTFEGTETGDTEVSELLEAMAIHDYNKTEMEDVSRLWTYWALFTGRAKADVSEYSSKHLSIIPKVINPYLEFVDPRSLSTHGVGVKGDFSARFYGYELHSNEYELKKMGITSDTEKASESKSMQDLRDNTDVNADSVIGENSDRYIYVWYTCYKGKKLQLLVSHDFKVIYKSREFKRFPIVDRTTNVAPKEHYPRSLPDLLEDKHKAKANIINSSVDIIREQGKPIYIVKEGSVRLDMLENAEAGDIVEAENINDIKPMQKSTISNDVNWLLGILDASSQEVTATPDIQKGVMMGQQRTASELNLVASGSKNRYGMTARIFGGSMKMFYGFWYEANMQYFDEVHKKSVKIAGVYGPQWRKIGKKDITIAGDLDIRIESKKIADQENMIERQSFVEFHTIASADPSYDIREGIRYIGRLSGIKTQQLNFLMKKTSDELEANQENEVLENNKLVDGKKAVVFHIRQDHDAHIREHMKLDQDIPAVKKHIEMHYEAKVFMKNNPDIMGMIGNDMTEQEQANMNMQDTSIGDITNPNKRALGLPTL